MSVITPAGSVPPGPGQDPHAVLRQTAKDFEGLFLSYVFRAMRDTIPQNDVEGGIGRDMFTSMFDDALARMAANQESRGLADGLYRQLARHVPANPPPPASRP